MSTRRTSDEGDKSRCQKGAMDNQKVRPCFTFEQLKKYNNVDLLSTCDGLKEENDKCRIIQPKIMLNGQPACPTDYHKYRQTLLDHIFKQKCDGLEQMRCRNYSQDYSHDPYMAQRTAMAPPLPPPPPPLPSQSVVVQPAQQNPFEILGQIFLQRILEKECPNTKCPENTTQVTNNYYNIDEEQLKKDVKCKKSSKPECVQEETQIKKSPSSISRKSTPEEVITAYCPHCSNLINAAKMKSIKQPPPMPTQFQNCACHCNVGEPVSSQPDVVPSQNKPPQNNPPQNNPPPCTPECTRGVLDCILEQSLTSTVNDCQDLLLSLLNEKLANDESFLDQICEKLILSGDGQLPQQPQEQQSQQLQQRQSQQKPKSNAEMNTSNNASGNEESSCVKNMNKLLDHIERRLNKTKKQNSLIQPLKSIGLMIEDLKKELSGTSCSHSLLSLDSEETVNKVTTNAENRSVSSSCRSETSKFKKSDEVDNCMGDIKNNKMGKKQSQLDYLRNQSNVLIYQLERLETEISHKKDIMSSDTEEEESTSAATTTHVSPPKGDTTSVPGDFFKPQTENMSKKDLIGPDPSKKTEKSKGDTSGDTTNEFTSNQPSSEGQGQNRCYDDRSFMDLFEEFIEENKIEENNDAKLEEGDDKSYKNFVRCNEDVNKENAFLEKCKMNLYKNGNSKPLVSFSENRDPCAVNKKYTEFYTKLDPQTACFAKVLQTKLKKSGFLGSCKEILNFSTAKKSDSCTDEFLENLMEQSPCPRIYKHGPEATMKKIRLMIDMEYPQDEEDECQKIQICTEENDCPFEITLPPGTSLI